MLYNQELILIGIRCKDYPTRVRFIAYKNSIDDDTIDAVMITLKKHYTSTFKVNSLLDKGDIISLATLPHLCKKYALPPAYNKATVCHESELVAHDNYDHAVFIFNPDSQHISGEWYTNVYAHDDDESPELHINNQFHRVDDLFLFPDHASKLQTQDVDASASAFGQAVNKAVVNIKWGSTTPEQVFEIGYNEGYEACKREYAKAFADFQQAIDQVKTK